MKKLMIGLISALVAFAAIADTTETWTNALGQVFTVTMSGVTEYPAYDTYDLAESAILSVDTDDSTDTITAKVMYMSGGTLAATATNVSFATPYPAGKSFMLINVGTNTIGIASSTAFDVGSAGDLELGVTDVLTMYAIDTDTCYRVSNSDN